MGQTTECYRIKDSPTMARVSMILLSMASFLCDVQVKAAQVAHVKLKTMRHPNILKYVDGFEVCRNVCSLCSVCVYTHLLAEHARVCAMF